MRILCFTDGFNQGGAERQLIGLANLLQNRGYDVTLASYHKYNFYKSLMEECNLKYHFIEGGNRQWTKLWVCYRYFKKEAFDCIISYKGGSNQICCILKAFGMSFKLLVSERCLVYNHNSYQKKKFFLYRFADKIIPNSYAQEDFIRTNYPHFLSKTVTITNFTDTNFFVPVKNFRLNDHFIILVTARISRQKNIERFLLAVKKAIELGNSFRVEWFGNVNLGEDSYAEQCKMLVKELDLESVFEFHEATNNIQKEYQKCDAFCLPSVFEGFPNVLCEAMSCGKPIICSDVCDNATIIEEGKNGYLFNPENIDDMADKLCKILHIEKNDLQQMGMYSRQLAEERFSQETFVNNYISVIEK